MANHPTPDRPATHVRLPFFQRIGLFVAAPVLFFCALEGALRLLGIGKSTEFFIPEERPGFYRTNAYFTGPFMPESFGIQPLNFRIRKHKEPGTVRVFVLGESAAQGIPDPDFGFAAQLRAQLKARFPRTAFEVFNMGITAIDSHVVYRVVRQVADFEPDLFVIYMGNNEVVGPYGPGCAYLSSSPPVWIIRSSVWVRSTRTGQLLTRLLAKVVRSGAKAADWKGMETFSDSSVRGDDARLAVVYRNFSTNLQDIVDFAKKAGIRTVLATVVANLKDSAPFVSLHRAGLSAEDLKSWGSASEAGRIAWDLGDRESAGYEYGAALRIDPEFAETHFRLGRIAEALGDTVLARQQLLYALHWDALRFRPDTRLNEIIRTIALGAENSVTLVDAARAMGSDPDSTSKLSGQEIQFDHVHFNWDGNFKMAQMLADACAKALGLQADRSGAELDAAGCGSSLGYTQEARLKMLDVIVQLMIRPPFTNQFTFTENQAALKREIELTNSRLGAPEAKRRSLDGVRRAIQGDPDNPSLLVRLATLESDAGDPAQALSTLEKAEALEPPTVDLSIRKAQFLMLLQRFDVAETVLLASLRLDDVYFSPSRTLVDLWSATKQFDKGADFFVHTLAGRPSNSYLRLEFANLLARRGDAVGAEREALRIWNADADSRPAMAALELLVRLYERDGRKAKADALTLEARTHQAGDYFNNQRLVRINSEKGDSANVAESLKAMATSGPFDSAEHLDLAHRLADLNRVPEMLDELSEAKAVAEIENNEGQLQAVNELISTYRRQFSGGQGL